MKISLRSVIILAFYLSFSIAVDYDFYPLLKYVLNEIPGYYNIFTEKNYTHYKIAFFNKRFFSPVGNIITVKQNASSLEVKNITITLVTDLFLATNKLYHGIIFENILMEYNITSLLLYEKGIYYSKVKISQFKISNSFDILKSRYFKDFQLELELQTQEKLEEEINIKIFDIVSSFNNNISDFEKIIKLIENNFDFMEDDINIKEIAYNNHSIYPEENGIVLYNMTIYLMVYAYDLQFLIKARYDNIHIKVIMFNSSDIDILEADPPKGVEFKDEVHKYIFDKFNTTVYDYYRGYTR